MREIQKYLRYFDIESIINKVDYYSDNEKFLVTSIKFDLSNRTMQILNLLMTQTNINFVIANNLK